MKAGKAGNVHRVAMSAVTAARTSAGLHDAVAAASRWSIGALGSDQNAPETPEDTATSLPDHGGSLCPKRMLFSRRAFQSSRVSNSWFEVSPLTIAMLAIIRRMSSRANLVRITALFHHRRDIVFGNGLKPDRLSDGGSDLRRHFGIGQSFRSGNRQSLSAKLA
jgi:hypothetical protein